MEQAILGAIETPRALGTQLIAKAPVTRADSHKEGGVKMLFLAPQSVQR